MAKIGTITSRLKTAVCTVANNDYHLIIADFIFNALLSLLSIGEQESLNQHCVMKFLLGNKYNEFKDNN